ncbi:hypothetical protein PUN28_019846 [Cardiocondyla obscurior]|uniref:Uncharacterized protein n=1 Tax=Cardiocondyla obscurior TaxID=286306 RepID=A0AAW2EBR1_9HYME
MYIFALVSYFCRDDAWEPRRFVTFAVSVAFHVPKYIKTSVSICDKTTFVYFAQMNAKNGNGRGKRSQVGQRPDRRDDASLDRRALQALQALLLKTANVLLTRAKIRKFFPQNYDFSYFFKTSRLKSLEIQSEGRRRRPRRHIHDSLRQSSVRFDTVKPNFLPEYVTTLLIPLLGELVRRRNPLLLHVN